jgi:hypothetical protein
LDSELSTATANATALITTVLPEIPQAWYRTITGEPNPYGTSAQLSQDERATMERVIAWESDRRPGPLPYSVTDSHTSQLTDFLAALHKAEDHRALHKFLLATCAIRKAHYSAVMMQDPRYEVDEDVRTACEKYTDGTSRIATAGKRAARAWNDTLKGADEDGRIDLSVYDEYDPEEEDVIHSREPSMIDRLISAYTKKVQEPLDQWYPQRPGRQ